MTAKIDQILQDALTMTASEKAAIVRCLISSIDSPVEENVEQEWLLLASKRLAALESGKVKPVSWKEMKQKVKVT